MTWISGSVGFRKVFSRPWQKWRKVEFSSEVKTKVIFELPGSFWVIWAIVKIPFRFGGIPSISVRFWTSGPTTKFIYQKLSRIENGVSGWFLHFVWTRVNSSKLEPVVLSSSEAHQKIYFSMLSNFCFMKFFGQSANNGLIDVRKTPSIYVDCPVAPPFGPKSKNGAISKVSRIKNWVF